MVVAYQTGLEELAQELQRHGYTVVPWDNAEYADALIYHYAAGDGSLLNATPRDLAAPGGMLLVNVNGIDLPQIMSILQYRRYSPIFE